MTGAYSGAGVILDRDGTLGPDFGYLGDAGRFVLYAETIPALRLLNEANLRVAVITNQAGVARGYFDTAAVEAIHRRMLALVQAGGAKIDGVYFCPHHPEGSVSAFAQTCDCRKPGTALAHRAAAELGFDLCGSYVVGDKRSDVELAVKFGGHAILVRTGYGAQEASALRADWQVTVVDTILDAARIIVGAGDCGKKVPVGTVP